MSEREREREKGACTLFRRANIVNCIVDDELKVLLQQSVDQRGVGHTLSICQQWTNNLLGTFITVIFSDQQNSSRAHCPNKFYKPTKQTQK